MTLVDLNWYQWLSILTFLLLVTTNFNLEKLKRHIGYAELQPSRKWKKATTAPKLKQKHVSDTVDMKYASTSDHLFYRDFASVADVLNQWFKDEPWSFQNTGRLEISGHGSEKGVEREIRIFYNQQPTGTIDVSCIDYGNANYSDKIYIELNLVNSRTFRGDEVCHLASNCAEIVLDTQEQLQLARIGITSQMVNVAWQVGPEAFGNPEIEFQFSGNASWFLSRNK